jgi:hypothetical protein
MQRLASIFVVSTLIALMPGPADRAIAQSGGDCSAYFAAVKTATSGSVPIVPDRLLADTDTSIDCLIRALTNLKGAQATTLKPEIRSQFLSITGALRAIISKLNSDDEKAASSKNIDGFIKTFRNLDNIDVISTLSYGVRGDSYEVRSNSLLLLANVIDNTTLCVPLDHLWDPALGKEDYSIRGRANLLAVVSVVAPWAYSENFANIQRIKNYVWEKIDRSDVNLKQTVDILNNIQTRLDSQTNNSNRTVDLPDDLKRQCRKYAPLWASADQLKY